MVHLNLLRGIVSIGAVLFLSLVSAFAQPITVQGIADRVTRTNSASFRVVADPGFTYEVTLNGIPVPAGVTNTVSIMDYYDLAVRRTQTSDGAVSSALYRFIVESSRRLKTSDTTSPELGLLEWIPLPPIPSTGSELTNTRLDLMMPSTYPAGLEIPVVLRVATGGTEPGQTRRVNGWVTNYPGLDTFRILRGVGHGFLPGSLSGDFIYWGNMHSLNTSKWYTVEATTTWTTVSGILGASTTWPADSRIHVTGNVTIPAGGTLTIGEGTVVWLNAGVNITNSGRTVINGQPLNPVVFTPTNRVAPEQRTGAWGGWIMRGGELHATAAIMTGSGAASSLDYSPGSSHRSEQPLFFAHNSVLRLTNCAAINLAGQVGNGYRSSIVWDRCLMQRAITCGEYDGGTNIIKDSAIIEFPAVDGVYNPTIVDADYDGFYTINTTNFFQNTLFGFCKDDAIDSGSGGAGTVVLSNCWVESATHEALAWSGESRRTRTYDTVLMNSGQGLECGWSTGSDSPLVHGENVFSTANCVGTRYGDNYTGTGGLGLKNGFLTATNSLFLYNYRDVWGQVWDNTWNWRTNRMDVRGNWLTKPTTNHPLNALWNPAVDAPRLAAFMTTGTNDPVGIGIALWPQQSGIDMLTNGVPVRLSSFTIHYVTVDYTVDTPGGDLAGGTLEFAPGETVKKITLPPSAVQGIEAARISLAAPTGGEITGDATAYLATAPSVPTPPSTTIIPYGSSWKYHDLGSNYLTAWRNPGFTDLTWSNGVAQLGFGDDPVDETTFIRRLNSTGGTIATFYFRKTLNVVNPSQYGAFTVRLLRDDAGIVYFNGTEVLRSPNMPAGEVTFNQFTGGSAPPDNTVDTTNVVNTGVLLSNGVNVVAVEVHQQASSSSDASFDLNVVGEPAVAQSLRSAYFGDTMLLFWSDPAYRLETTTALPGGWQLVPGAASPYRIEPIGPQRFYRLRR